MSSRPPYLSLALLSASALGYEILLMRLFSIIQWHHFAYLVIALALLGYGFSGTLLWRFEDRLVHHYRQSYSVALLLFSLTALVAFLLAQAIDFNIEELLWNPRQIPRLMLLFLLLSLPFLFAAGAICMTFMAYPEEQTSSIYAVDLLGAGAGSLAIIGLMYLLLPERILVLLSLVGLLATGLAARELQLPKTRLLQACLGLIALALLGIGPQIKLSYSPYKGLAQTLQIKGSQIVETRSSPLGYLSIVANQEVPLRHAPGLSLIADILPPPQLGLFSDADNLSAITAYPDSPQALGYLDWTTAALPYHLQRPQKLLVIGSGAGSDLLLARYHAVDSIDALELNPQVVALVNERFADYAGPVYRHPGTRLHIAEARDFLSHTDKHYMLIQMALIDAAGASASGLYALNESYLYTSEAMALYLSHLTPDGYLSITRWIKLPPRDTLKLFATALLTLRKMGVSQPELHLVLIRSWQTGTLLIKKSPFSEQELDAVTRFSEDRFFDLAYTPRLTEKQSNRYNQLAEPDFYTATQAMATGDIEAFFDRYKFNIRPASDDRPYFHHFFKWSVFLEALQLRGQGGMPLIEWGYVILLVTLAVTLLIGALLILLPLALSVTSREAKAGAIDPWRVVLYFFCIGLAFLFIEIAFIQRFLRFLHHPIYAITISLTAFLVFAGLGSHSCRELSRRWGELAVAKIAIAGIALLSMLYLLFLGWIFTTLGNLPLGVKLLLSIVLISPLAFLMGLPFPLALTAVKRDAALLIPWAWGVNGYASVISASLATLIAIHFGFTSLILAAVAIYLMALWMFPRQRLPAIRPSRSQTAWHPTHGSDKETDSSVSRRGGQPRLDQRAIV
ncbi:MAG: SAM-dependent methyltransferase [Candidatus Thiodiazotropha sp.]